MGITLKDLEKAQKERTKSPEKGIVMFRVLKTDREKLTELAKHLNKSQQQLLEDVVVTWLKSSYESLKEFKKRDGEIQNS